MCRDRSRRWRRVQTSVGVSGKDGGSRTQEHSVSTPTGQITATVTGPRADRSRVAAWRKPATRVKSTRTARCRTRFDTRASPQQRRPAPDLRRSTGECTSGSSLRRADRLQRQRRQRARVDSHRCRRAEAGGGRNSHAVRRRAIRVMIVGTLLGGSASRTTGHRLVGPTFVTETTLLRATWRDRSYS